MNIGGHLCSNEIYADDAALSANTKEETQELAKRVNGARKIRYRKLNVKTRMHVGNTHEEFITTSEEDLEKKWISLKCR